MTIKGKNLKIQKGLAQWKVPWSQLVEMPAVVNKVGYLPSHLFLIGWIFRILFCCLIFYRGILCVHFVHRSRTKVYSFMAFGKQYPCVSDTKTGSGASSLPVPGSLPSLPPGVTEDCSPYLSSVFPLDPSTTRSWGAFRRFWKSRKFT